MGEGGRERAAGFWWKTQLLGVWFGVWVGARSADAELGKLGDPRCVSGASQPRAASPGIVSPSEQRGRSPPMGGGGGSGMGSENLSPILIFISSLFSAAVNNSSDTESIPSPRPEAKEGGESGAKAPPGPGGDSGAEPAVKLEEAPTPPDAAAATAGPPAPATNPAPAASPPAEAAPEAPGGEEKAQEELVVDVVKTEEPEEKASEEPCKSEVKKEESEDGQEKDKGNDKKAESGAGGGGAAGAEGTPKAEKKESHKGSKGPGVNPDSDSSATCSADEMDEQDAVDKSR